MNLHDAATRFDKLVCYDAYTLSNTFKGQLDLYDDSKRDGTTVDRRVLSVSPEVTIPSRRTVLVHDDVFLMGVRHRDSFNNRPIRDKYVCHRADGLATVRNLAQTIGNTGGLSAYAAKVWVKDLKEVTESSSLYGFFNLYFSPAETVAAGSVVSLSGRLHLVRNSFISAAGLLIAESNELPANCLTTIDYVDKNSTYNPATDSYTTNASLNGIVALWHRHDDSFRYEMAKAERFQDGDIVVNVAKSAVANASPGDRFTMGGVTFHVKSVRDDGAGCWMLHSRP